MIDWVCFLRLYYFDILDLIYHQYTHGDAHVSLKHALITLLEGGEKDGIKEWI